LKGTFDASNESLYGRDSEKEQNARPIDPDSSDFPDANYRSGDDLHRRGIIKKNKRL
jgi:hypothetical protein